MNYGKMSKVLTELQKMNVDTDLASPNYVNDFSKTLCIELTNEEVIRISDDYIKTP